MTHITLLLLKKVHSPDDERRAAERSSQSEFSRTRHMDVGRVQASISERV